MNDSNIIKTNQGTVIMNGGDPIDDCPTDWDQAKVIERDLLNNGKEKEDFDYQELKWKFDCGYKLDYDGALLRISSRFYPPKTHYGPKWDGTVDVIWLGKTIIEQQFECDTLKDLKLQVEAFISKVKQHFESSIKGLRGL